MDGVDSKSNRLGAPAMVSCFELLIKRVGKLMQLLAGLVVLGACADTAEVASPVSKAAKSVGPNIIVILADDLGYNDVGAYGAAQIRTPNIDRLAATGVRFTDGYAAAAVCSPSRAGLMTGIFPARVGYDYNPSSNYMKFEDAELGLPTEQPTLADMLSGSGYATGLIGKWHLGARDQYHPMSRGFDEFYGLIGGGTDYFESPPADVVAWPGKAKSRGADYPRIILDGREPAAANPGYLTDIFRDKAVNYIARHKDEPFFLMLAPNAPHTPIEAPPNYVERNAHIVKKGARVYAAMVTAVDDMVGAVMDELARHDIADNTLVVFLSDNGCINYVEDVICSNAPLAGAKRYHLEGGVRVPFIVNWPAELPGGQTYVEPVSSVDLFATFAAASGAQTDTEPRPQDSVNLLPFLRHQTTGVPHEALFWRSAPNASIRSGKWKLWRVNKSIRSMTEVEASEVRARLLPLDVYPTTSPFGQKVVLYNLADDVAEQTNLADERPDIRDALLKELDRWEATLPAPLWPSRRSTLDTLDGQTVHLLF